MNRRDRPSIWFSTSSMNCVRSGGSTAIWCGTRSVWECACIAARGEANWNGARPRWERWLECSIIRSMPEPIPTGVAASITNERLQMGARPRFARCRCRNGGSFKRIVLPAYITWDQYLANQERLRQNRYQPGSVGAPREGKALLTGILVCGACGRRMHASYRSKSTAYYDVHAEDARGLRLLWARVVGY